jgi:Flp pilus assembly pilin Flp
MVHAQEHQATFDRGDRTMKQQLQRLCANSRGATAIEYALIAAMIAIAASGAIALFADSAVAMWEFVKDEALGSL